MAFLVAFVVMQLLFYLSFPVGNLDWTHRRVLFVVALNLAGTISIYLVAIKKLSLIARTSLLLIFANFLSATSPATTAYKDLKTLPHYMHQKLLVEENALPGFSGINTISTDEKGFRTLRAVNYTSNDTLRIFAIGASTTEQIYVDDKETWSSLLQLRLEDDGVQNVEVINTGVSGLRARQMYATQQYVEAFYPDYMIILAGVNDWNKHIAPSFHENDYSITDSVLFIAAQNLYNFLSGRYYEYYDKKFKVYDGNAHVRQAKRRASAPTISLFIDDVSSDYKEWITKIANNCDQGEYSCMFVTQPSAYNPEISKELSNKLWMTPPRATYKYSVSSMLHVSRTYNEWLTDFAESRNLNICDAASQLPATTQVFFDDVHFNENGSRLISNIIYKCLLDTLPQPNVLTK